MPPVPEGVEVRAARREQDADAIWRILEPTLRAGDTYAVDPGISRDDAVDWWTRSGHEVFVAGAGGTVAGTYHLTRNHGGGGSHVANAAYAVDPGARGQGVGRALAVHSLRRARERGFRAMQFNFVVSSNRPAVRLWRSLGFEVVGRIPGGFDHPDHGMVDALVMHREL